jgi:hypothetical protein
MSTRRIRDYHRLRMSLRSDDSLIIHREDTANITASIAWTETGLSFLASFISGRAAQSDPSYGQFTQIGDWRGCQSQSSSEIFTRINIDHHTGCGFTTIPEVFEIVGAIIGERIPAGLARDFPWTQQETLHLESRDAVPQEQHTRFKSATKLDKYAETERAIELSNGQTRIADQNTP